jgi:hypothetical protein
VKFYLFTGAPLGSLELVWDLLLLGALEELQKSNDYTRRSLYTHPLLTRELIYNSPTAYHCLPLPTHRTPLTRVLAHGFTHISLSSGQTKSLRVD